MKGIITKITRLNTYPMRNYNTTVITFTLHFSQMFKKNALSVEKIELYLEKSDNFTKRGWKGGKNPD